MGLTSRRARITSLRQKQFHEVLAARGGPDDPIGVADAGGMPDAGKGA